ncbi:MAG TPA: GntG family PLP-dependent aldolase [Acidimicrobiia bacterium]|jgi:threonine aldolase
MADAEVGDDAYGEDPTVRRLEALAAALLGKEAALYVPSGTMANQLALRLLGRAGTEVLCGERAHVYRYEHAAAAGNARVQLRPIPDADGTLAVDDIDSSVASQEHHLPEISALVLENTHMPACGRPWRLPELDAVTGCAHGYGLRVHCDGARIWNASIAVGEPPAALARGTDTVMFCLSKGLGAPVGSLLCGAADAIAAARADRARLGGGMRQAGVIAAAGVVALEHMVDRLADDHARARRLADVLAERFPGSVDPAAICTNIVCASARALPADFLDALAARGVLAGTIDVETVRFVTHKDVDDADLARAVVALDELARAGRPLPSET